MLAGAARAVAVAAVAIALGSCDRAEPAPFDGRPVRVEGRVVGAAGPVDGARVELVSPPYPEMPMMIVARTTTDRRGAFQLDAVPLGAVSHLVVSARGARRTYNVAVPASGPELLRVELPFAPDRELRISARCPGSLSREPSTGEPAAIWVELHWRGYWISQAQLLAADGAGAQSANEAPRERPLAPGFDERASPVPPDARTFERLLRVPSGTLEVRATGGCGEVTATVDVAPDRDAPPLVLALPGVPQPRSE